MPEGPEIHRAADQIAAAVEGERAELVAFGLDRLRPWETELTGARVTDVEAHGKAILTRFDVGVAVYSHNQLYGKWYVRAAGSYPKTGRSLRMEVRTPKNAAEIMAVTAASFGIGSVRAPLLALRAARAAASSSR